MMEPWPGCKVRRASSWGRPAGWLNQGIAIKGAQPLAAFQQAIERLLGEKE